MVQNTVLCVLRVFEEISTKFLRGTKKDKTLAELRKTVEEQERKSKSLNEVKIQKATNESLTVRNQVSVSIHLSIDILIFVLEWSENPEDKKAD